ncbi:Monooxygenase CTB7 [Hyphodiscus hymeniophilus]|uniref:Monooxygenase CTB7 n=1 Tax=Hyphodiscus hymeniophilus TaxID=353542 RepID=A0A9P6VK27_9HELO|nr:Monooxygenase CTB7 [Hyphodiscus hymeniophilus]
MPPLKVLIVGGGIAGPSLAYWLSRINAEVTLIERFPHIRATGQQVDLRAQGVPMMKRMGIEAAVRSAIVHEPGMQLINQNGQTKAYFPATYTNSEKQSLTSEFEIMRGHLVGILYGLTKGKENVRHVFDTAIEDFEQDDESDPNGKVHVRFSNGQREDFDLVVGADGSGSQTRKIMLGPDAPDPRYSLGGHIGFFTIPGTPAESNRWTLCHLPGGRIIGTRKDRPDLLRIYMIIYGKQPTLESAYQSGSLKELKKAWVDLYQGGGWECDRFMHELQHAPEADDLYATRMDEIHLPKGSWSKGRVVLLGDSAYCQTVGGLGATLSLVGAYVLAGEIASLYNKDGWSPTAAVVQGAKNYEERLCPIATAAQGGSKRGLSLLLPRSNFGIKVLQTIAGLAAAFKGDQLSSVSTKTSKWSLPTYTELECND